MNLTQDYAERILECRGLLLDIRTHVQEAAEDQAHVTESGLSQLKLVAMYLRACKSACEEERQ